MKKKEKKRHRLYLWISLWWCPVDIWWKKRTSSSFLQLTGCLSSGNLSEGRRRRAAWERGAPFQTLPLLTCSFSDLWWGEKMDSVLFLTPSPSLRHGSLCLPCCFHVLLPLWRTSSHLRWVFPSHSMNRCRLLKEERLRSSTVPVLSPPNHHR